MIESGAVQANATIDIGKLEVAAVLAYDGMVAIAHGLQAIASRADSLNMLNLLNALRSPDYSFMGASGTVKFTSDLDRDAGVVEAMYTVVSFDANGNRLSAFLLIPLDFIQSCAPCTHAHIQ